MEKENDIFKILLADDDPDDRLLAEEAMRESNLLNPMDMVEDGEELLAYLRREGKYSHLMGDPLPGLIILDLNMPRMNGREALKEIKSDPSICHIPVVVLTTSEVEEDIYRSYNLGVNSFITKPVTFKSFVELMQDLGRYWFEIVSLPNNRVDL
ncbi:MAG: response regulator [Pyrinomonadaceae bacterium]